MIGPNGSGKTTLFNAITGTLPIDGGSISFEGREISKLLGGAIACEGVIRTFQQPRIFSRMTTLANMLVVARVRGASFAGLFRKAQDEDEARAAELLDFVGLAAKHDELAGALSFGQQKLLELAMALADDPKLLLLDEPTAGINLKLVGILIEHLKRANRERGVTLLVIEHNMPVIMGLAYPPISERPDGRGWHRHWRSRELGWRRASGEHRQPQCRLWAHGGGTRPLASRPTWPRALPCRTERRRQVDGAQRIFGFAHVFCGSVTVSGSDITKLSPSQMLKDARLAYVLQKDSVFPDMTVEENLLMGGYLLPSATDAKRAADRVLECHPRLNERRVECARALSGGERRLLEISRALIMDPEVILIDEPSIGLDPLAIDLVFGMLAELRDRDGKTLILVEQNARKGLEFADIGYVLVAGRLIKAGSGRDVLADPATSRLFLGGD